MISLNYVQHFEMSWVLVHFYKCHHFKMHLLITSIAIQQKEMTIMMQGTHYPRLAPPTYVEHVYIKQICAVYTHTVNPLEHSTNRARLNNNVLTLVRPLADQREVLGMRPPPSRFNFFHSDAVFSKNIT